MGATAERSRMMLTPEQLAEWRDYVRTAKDTLVPMTKYELCSVLNHIDAQQARIAELEQDAARYRWLRDNLGKTVSHWICTEGGETLDEEIDAKMQK